MRRVLSLLLLLSLLPLSGREKKPPYRDPSVPVEARVEDLLSRMTLEEKLCQMQNRFVEADAPLGKTLGDNSWGTVFTLRSDAATCRSLMEKVQAYLRDSTRLGIPALPCAEGIQGILMNGSTLFPHALAQGSTFNPELIGRMASCCADEAAEMGIAQVLSPVLDIARDPRWGRVEECFGEDPFLIAEMGCAFVRGYQQKGVACTPKHFVAHGSPTGGLNCSGVSGGERELRSLYLYPFARVIAEAAPWSLMSSYNTYDGVAVSGSPWFMTHLLREELGFGGYVYSDWGAVERLADYHFMAEDPSKAARMALEAGIDLDVTIFPCYPTLRRQVEEGKVPMDLIDRAVRRILRVKFAMGLFERPAVAKESGAVRSPAHIALAKAIADESAVLLENHGILPLEKGRYRKIAVLGPNSDQTVFGDYAWPDAFAREGVSLLEGLRMRMPEVEFVHEDGCDWWSRNDSLISEAASLAARSDLAIVAVGSRSTFLTRRSLYNTSGEGNDLSSLELPGRQEDLLKAVKATGKPLIVILISGKPFAMGWVKDHADAFLVQWYGGEQQGLALADILTGAVNPSGRLNISFPRSTGNLPCYYNHYPSDREYYGGHGGSADHPRERYVFEPPYALWAFGSGLSYSTFAYRSASVSLKEDHILAEVEVDNTSERDGSEVVQLYVRDLVSSVAVPVRELKAFRKVSIPAHSRRSVRLRVPLQELALIDAQMQRRLEPGAFEIQIGSASDRIHLRDTVIIH